MKPTLPLVAVSFFLASSFGADRSAGTLPAVDLTCPAGHHAVRRVPVLNGLMAIDGQLRKKVDRFEVVLGGCTGSDTEAVLCGKCGFRYYEESKKWVRTSANWRAFSPVISEAVRRFERLFPNQLFEYTQEISDDGSIAERSALFSDESIETVRPLLAQRMNELSVKELVPGSSMWMSDIWNVLVANAGAGSPHATMVMITHQLKGPNHPPPSAGESPGQRLP